MKQQKVNINTQGMWDSRFSGDEWRVFPYEVLYDKYLHRKSNVKTLADYGCGLGEGIEYLSKQPNFKDTKFYGLDFSSEAINKANPDHYFILANFNEINEYPKVDLALVVHTLEHINKPFEFLERIKSVSREIVLAIPREIVPQGEHFSVFDLSDFDAQETILDQTEVVVILKGEL